MLSLDAKGIGVAVKVGAMEGVGMGVADRPVAVAVTATVGDAVSVTRVGRVAGNARVTVGTAVGAPGPVEQPHETRTNRAMSSSAVRWGIVI